MLTFSTQKFEMVLKRKAWEDLTSKVYLLQNFPGKKSYYDIVHYFFKTL